MPGALISIDEMPVSESDVNILIFLSSFSYLTIWLLTFLMTLRDSEERGVSWWCENSEGKFLQSHVSVWQAGYKLPGQILVGAPWNPSGLRAVVIMDKSAPPYVVLQHTYLIVQRFIYLLWVFFLLWRLCDKTGIKLLMFITGWLAAIVAIYAKQKQKNIHHIQTSLALYDAAKFTTIWAEI